jgi:hypothetical protein
MNTDDLIKKLENLDLPEVDLQSHRRRLKMVLLNSGCWKGETTMSLLKKRIVPVGGIIAIAAIIVVFSFVFKSATPPVSAQEIAQKSYNKVASLSPEQQETLKRTTGRLDSRDLLEEALNAEDLKVLTYEEFASQCPVPPDPDGKLNTLIFLQFTHSNGLTVILGIDQDYLPAFTSASYGHPPVDGQPSGEKVGVSSVDEKGILTVDGKKYKAPADTNGPSTIEVRGGDVYINGVKATPEE